MTRTEKLLAGGLFAAVLTQAAVGAWIALLLLPIERSLRYQPDYETELETIATSSRAVAEQNCAWLR